MLRSVWNASRNFDRLSAVPRAVDRLAGQPQPVVVIVFVVAAHHAQAMLLVLDHSPRAGC